jgi:hypothetical protein
MKEVLEMIYNYLPTYHQVEANNLKGLQPGFVVAQMDVASSAKNTLAPNGMMENGLICGISADGIVPGASDGVLFIHYTEPLNTVVPGAKYFAVNIEEECPRLVQLIPGDEWMSDIEGLAEDYSGRIVEITSASGQYAQDDFYACDEMPDGTKGHHYMFLG